jgi:hypothetical protein
MGFTVGEMKMVHARLSDLIAASGQELAETGNVLEFAGGINDDTQRLLANAAGSARSRRGRNTILTPEEEKADCLRLMAEIEAKMGRAWMKKHNLQEAKKLLEAMA